MSWKDRFREWLSDNLRYILLGLGILIAAVLIFFGIRSLTSVMEGSDNSKSISQTSSDSREEEESVTPSPEPEKKPEDEASQSSSEEEVTTLTRDGNEEITALMNTYYTALGGKNMEVLQTVVDHLSEDEQAQIAAETNIEGYQNIAAYTFNGQQEGTYVIIASFQCKYRDISTMAPGLCQMYVYTNTEGKLVIAAEVEDEAVNNYMSDILKQPEVKQLIADTQEAYEAARASDAKLDALITSVAGE